MLLLFQDNFILVEATSSRFFRVTTFRTVTFLHEIFFQSENSIEQPLLENRRFFIFLEELFRIKISKKELFFKAGTSAQHQPFQKSYTLEKTDFSENQFLPYLLFLKSCLFRTTTFSKNATFYSSYIFIRTTFLQHTFSAELLFHSYGSFRSHTFYLSVISTD